MHLHLRFALYFVVATFAVACGPGGDAPVGTGSGELGRVHFETTCEEAVAPTFDRGVALLHSFWFRAAIETFEAVLAADPECAMAECVGC